MCHFCGCPAVSNGKAPNKKIGCQKLFILTFEICLRQVRQVVSAGPEKKIRKGNLIIHEIASRFPNNRVIACMRKKFTRACLLNGEIFRWEFRKRKEQMKKEKENNWKSRSCWQINKVINTVNTIFVMSSTLSSINVSSSKCLIPW